MPDEQPRPWIVRATRPKTVPLALAPVVVGSAAAVGSAPRASWLWFAVALVVVAALHLGTMVINDVFDTRSGADRIGGMDRSGIVTGSGLIDAKVVPEGAMLSLAAALFGVAAAGAVALGVARSGAALWLALAGAVLGITYVAPPVRYGYRGLGAIGVFLAYGPLAAAAGHAVQTQHLGATGFWAGVIPGLLVAAAYGTGDLLHFRADKAVGKRTPAARFGAEGGLLVIAVLLIAAYAGVVVAAAFPLFGAWALLGLLPAVPHGAAWARAFTDPMPQRVLNLLGVSLGAVVLVSAVLALAAAF